MPGEQLMCVWEAVCVEDTVRTPAVGPPLNHLRLVTAALKCPVLRFRRQLFDETFPSSVVHFDDYKIYVENTLRVEGALMETAVQEIERICWSACRPTYKLEDVGLDNADLCKLWQVYIRLLSTGSYPPLITASQMTWIIERAVGSLRSIPCEVTTSLIDGVSFDFSQFVKVFQMKIFFHYSTTEMHQVITELYGWLVQEISFSGWLEKRTRKGHGDWTPRRRRWCILTPGKLTYYEDITCQKKKGEVIVTASTKVQPEVRRRASLVGTKTRVFVKLINRPYLEMELLPQGNDILKALIIALQKVKEASARNTTPIKELLQEKLDQDLEQKVEVVESVAETSPSTEVKLRRLHRVAVNTMRVASGLPERPQSPTGISSADFLALENMVQTSRKQVSDPAAEDSIFAWHIDNFQKTFAQADTASKGHLDPTEFNNLLALLGVHNISKDDCETLFFNISKKEKGQLDFQSWIQHLIMLAVKEPFMESKSIGSRCPRESVPEAHNLSETDTLLNELRTALICGEIIGNDGPNMTAFTIHVWEKRRQYFIERFMMAINETVTNSKERYSFRHFLRKSIIMSEGEVIKSGTKNNNDYLDVIERCVGNVSESCDIKAAAILLWQTWKELRSQHASTSSSPPSPNENVSFNKGMPLSEETSPDGDVSSNKGMTLLDSASCLVEVIRRPSVAPCQPPCLVWEDVKWHCTHPDDEQPNKLTLLRNAAVTLPVVEADQDWLAYYDCAFAETPELYMGLMYHQTLYEYPTAIHRDCGELKHGTTEEEYLSILTSNSATLICPLVADSGMVVLGKQCNDSATIHLTGFRVPCSKTLYISAGVIQGTCFKQGPWKVVEMDNVEIESTEVLRTAHGDLEAVPVQLILQEHNTGLITTAL